MRGLIIRTACVGALLMVSAAYAAGQSPAMGTSAQKPANGGSVASAVPLPPGYVIGADDVLSITFWRDKELSGEVVVRPDGMISLPLLDDVQAVGYTPEQLSAEIEKAAQKYIADPDATVTVREIRSRKVYVVGEVARPGVVPLNSDMTVLQLIATVGGVLEYADKGNITILRTESGREHRFKFNYEDVIKGKNVKQNILLKPGDTVVVR